MKSSFAPILIVLFLFSCQGQKEEKTESPDEIVDSQEQSPAEFFFGRDYYVDASHSYIGFKIKYFGFSPVRGRFDDFDATVFYNENNINDLSVTVSIASQSIKTGNDHRDEDLTSEATWFDAPNFPKISFRSLEIIPKSEGEFDLIGEITLKGISRVDTFQFEKPTDISHDWAMNDQVDFSGITTINRQDFEVFGSDFWSSIMENGLTQLSDEVEIEVDIHCRKSNYKQRYESMDSTDKRKVILDIIKENGISDGLQAIDESNNQEKLRSRTLSSLANILNAWEMHEEALSIFEKQLEYFPDKFYTWNWIGITNLYLGNVEQARKNFNTALQGDPDDPRAKEYLRLLDR